MMELWHDNQQGNRQATEITANVERDVDFVFQPPSPPSPTWQSSIQGRSGTQKTKATTTTRGANHFNLNAEATKSNKSKPSSGLGNHGIADGHPDPPQRAASGTVRQIRRPTSQLDQQRGGAAEIPAPPAETKEIIRVKVHRRIVEKVLGVRYTKIHEKVTSVEDFKHANLDDHDHLDEAFYKFRTLMKERHKDLRLPGSRKPYGRVIIEEEGPPPKRTACILLRPFRDETEVTAYHAILSKSIWREHYSPLTLLYEKQRSSLDYLSAHPEARLLGSAPKDTLCGTLAMIGNENQRRVVTIGGILQRGDDLWASTAAHSTFDEDEGSIPSTVETLTENMIHPEEYPEDVSEALIFEKPDTGAQSEPVVPPTHTSSVAEAVGEFARLLMLGEAEESGEDWSLIRIEDRSMALPNAAHAHDSDGGILGLENAVYLVDRAEKHPGPCDAEVLAGVSGPVAVKMTAGHIQVPLPSGSWISAWECIVKSGSRSLQHGDSGSWIVNPESGTVYGQVVAKMGASVFMLPMKALIDEIEEHRTSSASQPKLVLPSPSALLTDLAEYHRIIFEDTETADKYEQAALRASKYDKSEDTGLSVRPNPVPTGSLVASDSAVSKPWWTEPARTLVSEMRGRGTAKEHSPTTPMPSEQEVSRSSVLSYTLKAEILSRFTHTEFSRRAELFHSLNASYQRHINAYLRRVTQIRGNIASDEHSSLLDNVLSSVNNWRDTIQDKNVTGWRRIQRGTFPGPKLSERSMHQGSSSQNSLEYDPLMDINVTKTKYSGSYGFSKPYADVEQEVVPLKDLLENPARWLEREIAPDNVTPVTHIHIPATNMEWAQKVIQFANGHYVGQLLCPNSRRRTAMGTWRMQTTVNTLRERSPFSYSFATVICVPFLDWDRPHRFKMLTRDLRQNRRDQKKEHGLRAIQEHPMPKNKLKVPFSPSLSKRSQLGKTKQFMRDDRDRLLAGTALGQLLLDAAILAMAMSTHRDRVLWQRYAHSHSEMSFRQPFVRQDSQPHGFSYDDILYRAKMPERHLKQVNQRDKKAEGGTRMLMLGDLWAWVLKENTILTCLAPRIGEDANFDSRNLQTEIQQVLSDRLHHSLECTVDNILAVILEVCLGTTFKGLQKDPQDIDLMGIAESEIDGLSHQEDLSRNIFSNTLSAMTAATPAERHSAERTKTQTLIEDESLSASLSSCISQLEEIVGLTSQQIAALSNLTRLHNILEQGDTVGGDQGVMHLSRNVPFVQLQFRLDERMKELEELLRRAKNAKSSLDDAMSKQIWFLKNDTAAPVRSLEKDTATVENPSAVPVILATFLPLIFTTTLFSAIDVGRLFWIMFPIGFTLLCATMLVFMTPLWRTLRASMYVAVMFLVTHTGLYRLLVSMKVTRSKNAPSVEDTAVAMTERWKQEVRTEREHARSRRRMRRMLLEDLERSGLGP